jgi:hypothetical protein
MCGHGLVGVCSCQVPIEAVFQIKDLGKVDRVQVQVLLLCGAKVSPEIPELYLASCKPRPENAQ